MECTSCRYFTGTDEPTRIEGENPPGCECPIGVICPDLIERARDDGTSQGEIDLADESYISDLRSLQGPDGYTI